MAGTWKRLPTSFTPRQVIERRLQSSFRRDDRFSVELKPIQVPFVPDFDQFVAQVAHALGRLLKYRSDDGKFARGLIRINEDIHLIYLQLVQSHVLKALGEGELIGLDARIWRRVASNPEDRWVMRIKFGQPNYNVEPDFKDPEIVEADPKYPNEGGRRFMAGFLPRAKRISKKLPGESGKRIRKVLALADELGDPRNRKLWYYNPSMLHIYRLASDEERVQMLKATGGTLPADGGYRGLRWRIYPFQDFAAEFAGKRVADEKIRARLRHMDSLIIESLSTFWQDQDRPHGSTYSHMYQMFMIHLRARQKDPKHLYSAYK